MGAAHLEPEGAAVIEALPPLDAETAVAARFLRGMAAGAYAAGAMILPMVTIALFRLFCRLLHIGPTTGVPPQP